MILAIIGYMVIFMAVDYGRKEDSKFPLFSWKWFIIILKKVYLCTLIKNMIYEQRFERCVKISYSN